MIAHVFVGFEVDPIPNVKINKRIVLFRIIKNAPRAEEGPAFVPLPNVTLLFLKPNT